MWPSDVGASKTLNPPPPRKHPLSIRGKWLTLQPLPTCNSHGLYIVDVVCIGLAWILSPERNASFYENGLGVQRRDQVGDEAQVACGDRM